MFPFGGYIYPSSQSLVLIRIKPEPFTADFRREVGDTMDWLPIYNRAGVATSKYDSETSTVTTQVHKALLSSSYNAQENADNTITYIQSERNMQEKLRRAYLHLSTSPLSDQCSGSEAVRNFKRC